MPDILTPVECCPQRRSKRWDCTVRGWPGSLQDQTFSAIETHSHKAIKIWLHANKCIQDLGEFHWMQRLLDPRPGDVFLTVRHPPKKTVSLALGATRPRRPKCPKFEFLFGFTWWAWWAYEACRSRCGGGSWGRGAARSQWRWLRSTCRSTHSWTNMSQLWYGAFITFWLCCRNHPA